VSSLAHLVDDHYNHLSSLRTRYTERYQGMGMDRTESGTLTLRKPGRMRWAYDAPAGKLFVLDGKTGISYTPGDAQAERFPARQLDDLRSPLRFLLGHTELAKELDHLTAAPVEGGYSLSGSPHGMSQRLRAVIVTVDARGVIHSLRMEEVDGATTTFQFTDMRENVAIPESDFSFVPPPGVTVVNGTTPM
jgi:outer membrane lipoprotein carrier protein